MSLDAFAVGLLWYVVFLLSTVCHESAHALVAKWGGDPTAFHGGQVTLNPVPHIRREPFGMVVFPLLTYFLSGWMMGWASAPYDPAWSRLHPRRAAKMALAGPAANFALAALAALAIHVGIGMGSFVPPEAARFTEIVDPASPGMAEAAAKFFSLLFSLNILLGSFNLLPVPPLDGFNAVAIFMTDATARRFTEWGFSMRRFSYLGLIIGWRIFDSLYGPIFRFALRVLYP
ncbi:MAG TPA: site-2 protease family protein [Bryobacteraceae bacterium]|jgi:Zn-dependent protease